MTIHANRKGPTVNRDDSEPAYYAKPAWWRLRARRRYNQIRREFLWFYD